MGLPVESVESAGILLTGGETLQPEKLCLQLAGYRLGLRSNSAAFIERMRSYFAHVIVPPGPAVNGEVVAVERGVVDVEIPFVDWKREPGKTGRKDAIYDFPGGRLVQKVRTGMVFLQSSQSLVAAGPCLEFDNQVINFINSQFLNWLQNDGYLLCHAAALSRNGSGLAIAGLSGGGKSTLMLNLLEDAATRYVTNDRLLVRRSAGMTHAVGIPKMPRINPGTIVNNPRLHPLIDAAMREELLQLDKPVLWELEQKYDAEIDRLYGDDRIEHETRLHRFLVLNWTHDDNDALQVKRVMLPERPDLLCAIMKPAGPFYVDENGVFNTDDAMPEPDGYLESLEDVEVFEASGRVDFEKLGEICNAELLG